MGWDSLAKIELLKESMLNIDIKSEWKNVVPITISGSNLIDSKISATNSSPTVSTLDDLHQNFLQNLQSKIAKTNQTANSTKSSRDKVIGNFEPRLSNVAMPSTPLNNSLNSPILTPKVNVDSPSVRQHPGAHIRQSNNLKSPHSGNDKQLADFFQNLLKKSSSGSTVNVSNGTRPSLGTNVGNTNNGASARMAKNPMGNLLTRANKK